MDYKNHLDTIIIGAGQAGLSTSYFLKKHEISHVVLERGVIGNTWLKRWDSFRLNSPNQFNFLPGESSDITNPTNFISGLEFADRLVKYTYSQQLPVVEKSEVISLDKSN